MDRVIGFFLIVAWAAMVCGAIALMAHIPPDQQALAFFILTLFLLNGGLK